MTNMNKQHTQCLMPQCGLKAWARGLCTKHYTYAQRLVKEKETTWEKLEKQKKAMPRTYKKGTRTSNAYSWFMGP